MENLLDIGESEEMQETAARTPVAEQSPDVPSEAAPCDRDACDGGARQRDGEIRSQEDAATPCRSCGRPSEWHLHVAAGGRPERTWFCCEALWETVREAWGHEVPAPWHAEDAEGPNSAVLVQERRDRIVARILERQDELHRTVSFALPAPRCPPAHPTEPHSSARQPGAQPHARGPLIPGGVCAQRGEVVERFYEGGRKFSTFFADGTGHVLDPAGRVVLQAARGPGGRLVWVAWAQGGRVLAVLGAAGGGAVCVSASGGVRLVVTPSGGRCYGAGGWETRRWLWEDAAACGHHVHAPPLQPVDVPLGARAPRVRLLTREDAVLTYVARNRSVRLRVAYQPKPLPCGCLECEERQQTNWELSPLGAPPPPTVLLPSHSRAAAKRRREARTPRPPRPRRRATSGRWGPSWRGSGRRSAGCAGPDERPTPTRSDQAAWLRSPSRTWQSPGLASSPATDASGEPSLCWRSLVFLCCLPRCREAASPGHPSRRPSPLLRSRLRNS
ncbi:uncharacterized protein LOC116954553 isoform X3 [Petromyzon marinus]|uniref:uncharacterized protein LOC116954553 isoform X3 n=1 Tax=Petromyzon marinus TaxID=7757 RepID=UPI003F7048CF